MICNTIITSETIANSSLLALSSVSKRIRSAPTPTTGLSEVYCHVTVHVRVTESSLFVREEAAPHFKLELFKSWEI